MSYRLILVIATFVWQAAFATADMIEVKQTVQSSRDCRTEVCTFGDVQPVLNVQPTPRYADTYFEGVAAGKDGSIYVAEGCTGQVYRIRPNGKKSVIATIPYGVENDFFCNAAFTLGLAVSDDGDVWVAVVSISTDSHGVWRVKHDGSVELAVPMTPYTTFPNGLVFDRKDNLYITDSYLGVIWKVPPGGVATEWLRNDLLAPTYSIGANGIARKHDSFFVINTDLGTVVKVPISRDGSPGKLAVISSGLNGPDGITFDAFGDLYLVTANGAELVRICNGGNQEVVLNLAAAGVAYPTSLDFGKSPKDMSSLYIADFFRLQGEANVVKINLCERQRVGDQTGPRNEALADRQ